jgi:hypothetical protein
MASCQNGKLTKVVETSSCQNVKYLKQQVAKTSTWQKCKKFDGNLTKFVEASN